MLNPQIPKLTETTAGLKMASARDTAKPPVKDLRAAWIQINSANPRINRQLNG